MTRHGSKSSVIRGQYGRAAIRGVGISTSTKSPELQALESVNARIVFAISGGNERSFKELLPEVQSTVAKNFVQQGLLFLGLARERDTYLHLAAKGNKTSIFSMLLQAGFGDDLEQVNKMNLRPGQYASPAITALIQIYKSEQAGQLGQGQGVLVAAKLAPSAPGSQPR